MMQLVHNKAAVDMLNGFYYGLRVKQLYNGEIHYYENDDLAIIIHFELFNSLFKVLNHHMTNLYWTSRILQVLKFRSLSWSWVVGPLVDLLQLLKG